VSRAITTAAFFAGVALLLLTTPLFAAEPDPDLVECIERLDAAERRLERATELNEDAAAMSPEIAEDFRKAHAVADKVETQAREWAEIEKAASFPLEAVLGIAAPLIFGGGAAAYGVQRFRSAKKLLGPMSPHPPPSGGGALEVLDHTPTHPSATTTRTRGNGQSDRVAPVVQTTGYSS